MWTHSTLRPLLRGRASIWPLRARSPQGCRLAAGRRLWLAVGRGVSPHVGDAVSRWDRRSGSAHGLPACFRGAPRRLGGRRGEIAERRGVLRCEQHLHQVVRWRGSVGRRRAHRRHLHDQIRIDGAVEAANRGGLVQRAGQDVVVDAGGKLWRWADDAVALVEARNRYGVAVDIACSVDRIPVERDAEDVRRASAGVNRQGRAALGRRGRRPRGRRSCAPALLFASAAALNDNVVSFEEPPHAASSPASTSGVPIRARRLLRQCCLAPTFTHASDNLLKLACVAECHHRRSGFTVATRDDLGAVSHGGGRAAPAPGCGQMVKFRLSGVSPSGLRLRFIQRSLEDDHGY